MTGKTIKQNGLNCLDTCSPINKCQSSFCLNVIVAFLVSELCAEHDIIEDVTVGTTSIRVFCCNNVYIRGDRKARPKVM